MTGKERVLGTLVGDDVDGVPWVPFTGVHAGKLVGYTATEVLQDADKLIKALTEAHRDYQPDGMPVIFDLQVEAEILGCDLLWADQSPPTVSRHPLAEDRTVPKIYPEPTDGRLPIILDAMKRFSEQVGSDTALFGLVCGPFTLASHLRGTEIFLDMMDDPGYVKQLIAYCSEVNIRVAGFYADAGMDVLASVDPLVSQISEDHFREFLFQPSERTFDAYRQMGKSASLFVCGDATRSIRAMCETKPDALFVDENVDLKAAKQIAQDLDVVIGGNLPLSSVMLLGSQNDNMQCVLDEMETVGTDGLVVAPGCDMPYDTPAENVVGVMQAIRDPESAKQILATAEAVTETAALDVVAVDYGSLSHPMIEVFTLDSASCPACSYMMYAVNAAKEELGDSVEVAEYKIVERENLARAQMMQIKNLPCVLINGELVFSSLIPNHAELLSEIEARR